jgi:acetoin utilization deacetylase AcuC-like enzyme
MPQRHRQQKFIISAFIVGVVVRRVVEPVFSFSVPLPFRRYSQVSLRSVKSPIHENTSAYFQYSPSSLRHLENTEIPDDYSRPWTPDKIKAMATALGAGIVLGLGGEILVQNFFDVEKSFVFWVSIGAAAGWFIGGGRKVAQDEKPINGGYDRKLIADLPSRLRRVLEDLELSTSSSSTTTTTRDLSKIRSYVERIHEKEYIARSREADRPQRLNPVYARTLVDEHSFNASLHAVADWLESVDAALEPRGGGRTIKFALVRPPSHHACKGKGMGGCLINSVAVAACYALDQPSVQSVAILDVDAHHGNGIAHCIQDIPSIRYCSIHEAASNAMIQRDKEEDSNDPRSSASSDCGPLGNILNINLPSNTGWENGYRTALVDNALPFLLEREPDILLVAAGFDALEADQTSKLKLKPRDFREISILLKEKFGSRVAMGLEGGYCWQNGELSQAIRNFVEPWQEA